MVSNSIRNKFNNAMVCLLIAIVLTGCRKGSMKPLKKEGDIGLKLISTSGLYNQNGSQSSYLYAVDTPTHRIHKMKIDELSVHSSFEMTMPEIRHYLASDPEGRYVVDFSTKHLEIINAQGVRTGRLFSFQGTPKSAAFNPQSGVMVMQDDLQSIGVMTINAEGVMQNSWVGGPLLGEGKLVIAGDLNDQSQLLLATSDQKLNVVSIENTMASGKWAYESFDLGLENVNFVAPDMNANQVVLLASDSKLATFDMKTRTRLELINIDERKEILLGTSKMGKPHVFVENASSGVISIYFLNAEGVLKAQPLPLLNDYVFVATSLSIDGTELVGLKTTSDKHDVYKMRLSDNLVVLNESIVNEGEATLGLNILFQDSKSVLGGVSVWDLNTREKSAIKGYNFDFYRGR